MTSEKSVATELRLGTLIAKTPRLVLGQAMTVNFTADTIIGSGLGNGFSVPVLNGETWVCDCALAYVEGAVAAGVPHFAFHGPTLDASKSFNTAVMQTTAGGGTATTAGPGTGYGVMSGPTMNATRTMICIIRGSFTFTANGTLTLQTASSVAADTFQITQGSWCKFALGQLA